MQNHLAARIIISVLGIAALSGCATRMHNFPDTTPSNVKVIVAHNITAKKSIHPAFSLLSTVASMAIAPPGFGQLATDLAGQVLIVSIGDETAVTMLDKLDQEVYRQASCALLEKGYEVSLAGFNSWEDTRPAAEIKTAGDFYDHLETYYGYPDHGVLKGDHDAVVLIEYSMTLQDNSVGDYLTDLRVDKASTRVIGAPNSREGELLFEETRFAQNNYTRLRLFDVFKKIIRYDNWPLIEQTPISRCSNKSLFQAALSQELKPGSTIPDIQRFLEKHNTTYRWNKGGRYFRGKFDPVGGPDIIDDTVEFTIYYYKTTSTISKSDVYYSYQRPSDEV